MELEAKFAILGPLNPNTLDLLDLGPYQLHPDAETHHQDVLLDTPTRAITSGGHVLRVRQYDGHVLATFKGPNRGSDGVHEREEIEVPLSSASNINYRTWPTEIAERVGPLVQDAPLAPLVKMYIHRHTWTVLRDGHTIGEMALDQGIISAGGRTARVHELEVELKREGTRAELDDLGQMLREQLPLQPQSRGKLQRGLGLLRQHRTLDGHTLLESVGRHAVHRHLRKLRRSEPIARAGADPEGVHDMRTATRRLRTTLQILEESPVFRRQQVRALRRDLRGLARTLGAVRDLDVLMKRVEDYYCAHQAEAADLEVLRRELRARQRTAREKLLTRLDSSRMDRLLADLEAFATQPREPVLGNPPVFVRHFAGSTIWLRYEAVLGYETVVRDASPPVLHRLRIACKRLRYALELFEGELGKGTQPLIKALVKVQDHLGTLQDCVVALNLVAALSAKHPANAGLRTYAVALGGERDQLQETFASLWNDLSDAGFGQELAELIANL
jgi:inorganic triphosphatase YgiF